MKSKSERVFQYSEEAYNLLEIDLEKVEKKQRWRL